MSSFTVIRNSKLYIGEIKSAKKTLTDHIDSLKKEKIDLQRQLRKTDQIMEKINIESFITEIDSELNEFKGMFR